MAGPLLANLFRVLFRKLLKDMNLYVQSALNAGKEVNYVSAIKAATITNGLRYSLATGNWGL